MMRLRGMGSVRRAAGWLRHRYASRGLILLYHRVIDLASPDPFLLCVTPQHFAEHLEMVHKHGYPMQLQQLAQALRDGKLPRRAVAVTFDDGYADNLHYAKPVLERCDTPATVFVTTGCLGQEREFWWDELEQVVLQPGTLPETLCLHINGSAYQWALGEAVQYSTEEYWRARRWHVGQQEDPGLRQRLYLSLYQLLRPVSDGERRQVLDALLKWASTQAIARSSHRALAPDEVVHLGTGGLVEIGAHTVTHPALSLLPAAAQRTEILGSKTRLEEILGYSVTSFAYPYGSPSDYTAETSAMVQEARFSSACATCTGLVWQGADRFQLPRVQVRDWDGEAFERRLQAWLQD